MKTYANIDQKDISFFSKGKRKKFKVLEKELPFIKMLNDKYNPIQSVEMTKSPSKQIKSEEKKQQKQRYFLVLKNKKGFTHNYKINFGPKKVDSKKNQRVKAPSFNDDKRIYTPSFTHTKLHKQKVKYYNDRFERYIKCQEGNKMLRLPKPKNQYCQICRQSFQNYFQHIQSGEHIQQLRNCWAQKKLLKVCEKMKQRFKKREESLENRKKMAN